MAARHRKDVAAERHPGNCFCIHTPERPVRPLAYMIIKWFVTIFLNPSSVLLRFCTSYYFLFRGTMVEDPGTQDLARQLVVEQERVSKLKQLILREKRNAAQLKNEIDRLTTELTELRWRNCALESDLSQSKNDLEHSPTNGCPNAETEPSATLQNDDEPNLRYQLRDCLLQLEQLNAVLRQKDATMVELQAKCDGELHEHVHRITELEAELESSRHTKSQTDDLLAQIALCQKRECQLRNELDDCQLKLSLELEKTGQLRKVIETMDSGNGAGEQLENYKRENERLSLELLSLQERCKIHNCLLAGSQQEVKTLSLSQDALRDQLHTSTIKDKGDKDPVPSSEETDDHNPGTRFEQLRRLLTNVDCESPYTVNDDQLLRNFVCLLLHDDSSYPIFVNNVCFSSKCPVCGERLTSLDTGKENISTPPHQQPTVSTECVQPNQPHISIAMDSKALITGNMEVVYDCTQNSEFNEDANERLLALETKVRELELYTVELVERAKLQTVELMQKVEIQSADYDHLIRDKEAEISELRETCDRLMDETSAYCNFCYSIMTFYCATCVASSPKENLTDWSMAANTLKANDGTLGNHRLTKLLDLFAQELINHLDRNVSHADSDIQHFQESTKAEYNGLKISLSDALVLLEREKERAFKAEDVVREVTEQLQKQESKISRMKSLLLRLKQDEQQHSKTCSALAQTELTVNTLKANLEGKQQELEHVRSAKDQLDCLLNSLRDDLARSQAVIEDLTGERDFAVDRLNKLQNEFIAYKVKALHALRGVQPTEDTVLLPSDSSISTPINCTTHPNELDQLNEQMTTMKQLAEEESLRASLARTECDLLREELVELKRKYGDLLKEFNDQRQRWESQLATFTSERWRSAKIREKELEERLESERQRFESQLHSEKLEHQQAFNNERSLWAERLEQANTRIQSLEEHLEGLQRRDYHNGPYRHDSVVTPTPDSYLPHSPKFLHNRVQGDGADNVVASGHISPSEENEFRSPSHSPTNSSDSQSRGWPVKRKSSGIRPFLPLDQLLSSTNCASHDPISPSSVSSPSSTRTFNVEFASNSTTNLNDPTTALQISGLRNALHNQQRRVEHLSELLHESEATVGRLEEQAKVLKDEIRRLEKLVHLGSQFPLSSQTPQPTASSMKDTDHGEVSQPTISGDAIVRTEYLKNVILKVVSLPSDSSERAQLATVLSTMLMLTPAETQLLQQHQQQSTETNSGASWSSYLLGWER
ncbi:golgin IMH1 [Clonorchis sinensis]|uniref:Golgin IMH1 n=1 Tax=Clonorchis sinensis TaxID=79923 RepID=H2KP07_CLOSI|nr:golgin IMH1 [Clonorchis sinensis]